jgi:hypothetical protein
MFYADLFSFFLTMSDGPIRIVFSKILFLFVPISSCAGIQQLHTAFTFTLHFQFLIFLRKKDFHSDLRLRAHRVVGQANRMAKRTYWGRE